MNDARPFPLSDCEILVERELRRSGIEPVGLRRHPAPALRAGGSEQRVDLVGRLEAYGRRWSALIECRSRAAVVQSADIDALRRRADGVSARSALLFAAADFSTDAVMRADELRTALLRILDARSILRGMGLMDAGALPAWVPEYSVELVTLEDGAVQRRPLEADQPELILRQLRSR